MGLIDGVLGVRIAYLIVNIVLFYSRLADPGALIDLTCGMVLRSLKVEFAWALAVAAVLLLERDVVAVTSVAEVVGFVAVASSVYRLGAILLDDAGPTP